MRGAAVQRAAADAATERVSQSSRERAVILGRGNARARATPRASLVTDGAAAASGSDEVSVRRLQVQGCDHAASAHLLRTQQRGERGKKLPVDHALHCAAPTAVGTKTHALAARKRGVAQAARRASQVAAEADHHPQHLAGLNGQETSDEGAATAGPATSGAPGVDLDPAHVSWHGVVLKSMRRDG